MTNPTALAAVALLVGVVAGVWLPLPLSGVRVVLVVVWALAVAAVGLRAGPVPVTVVLVAGFTTGGLLLGATRHAAALETPLARWFADQPGADTGRVGPVLLEGRLRADAMPTDYGVALRLTVARVGRAGAMRTTSGGVRLSVGGRRWSGWAAEWRAGRVVRVYATLRPPAAYRNPGVADQARRQAMRGTALLGSVKSGLLVEVVRRGSPPAELAATTRVAVRRVIGREVEGRVAGALDPVAFRIVKVPHHGSARSSSPGLVEATATCVAIVSAGHANPFGHPAPEVVRRYRDAGALVLETGREGAVVVETDGRQVLVWTAVGRHLRFAVGGRRCEYRASCLLPSAFATATARQACLLSPRAVSP